MHVMTLEAEVGSDGFVHLDLPVDLPPGRVEIPTARQIDVNQSKPSCCP